MLEDPTVVHSFAAVGGASTLFTIFHVVRGVIRFINTKRADATQEQRNTIAEFEDLKETVKQLTAQADRLKALVPSQPSPAPTLPTSLPWGPVGGVGVGTGSNG